MTEFPWIFSQLMILSCAQTLLYRCEPRKNVANYWRMVCFYAFVLALMEAIFLACQFLKISFYALPAAVTILFFLFSRPSLFFPDVPKNFWILPNFYFFSSLWWSLLWMDFWRFSGISFHTAPFYLLEGLLWSVLAASFFLILSAVKERLEMADLPNGISVEAVLMLATGIFLIPFLFLNF